MNKNRRLPQIILASLLLGIILCFSIGLSIWLITDRIEIKPELGAEEIIKKYMDNDNASYDLGNILLPSSAELGLDMKSEDLTYYYKEADSQGNYILVDVENKLGPINAGEYLIKVEYVVSEDTNPDDDINDSVIATIEDLKFTINKRQIDVTNLSFTGKTVDYNRQVHNIEVTGERPSTITGINYTCDSAAFAGASDAGTYNVKATFVYDTVNYETVKLANEQYVITNDYLEATLQINKKSISLATLSFIDNANGVFYHTGSLITEIESTFIVTDDDGTILEKDKDYTVEFSDRVNLGLSHTVTVKGINNYDETTYGSYKIQVRSTNLVIIPNYSEGASYQVLPYNGQVQRPSVTVTDGEYEVDGVNLSYDVESKDAKLHIINVTASKDGYNSVTEEVRLLIEPAVVTLSWSWSATEYDGQLHNPTVTASGIYDDGYNVSVELSEPKKDAGSYTAIAKFVNNALKNYKFANGYEQAGEWLENYSFAISKRKISLDKSIYPLAYNSSVRTWNQIKTATLELLTFDRVVPGDTLGHSILGMHNGIYSYGVSPVGDLDTSMTNVVGSTYQVSISITNTNYQLTKNTFVLKYQTALVDGTYCTIEDAFSSSYDITFAGNSSGASTYVATCFTKLTIAQGNPYNKTTFKLEGRKLLIPFESSTSEKHAAKGNPTSGNVYSTFIVPNGITIMVTGSTASLVVGAKLGYNQNVGTAVASARGVLVNNGDIILGEGNDSTDSPTFKSYGYTKGTGLITLNNYSKGVEGMTIYDFSGGSAAIDVQSYVIPMNSWSMHSNACKTKIVSGATYSGYINIEISMVGFLDSEFLAIGKSANQNCIFLPTSIENNNYIIKNAKPALLWENDQVKYKDQYALLSSITGSNQTRGQLDVFEINGSYSDASFQISINPGGLLSWAQVTLSTEKGNNKPCPISFQNIIINDGGTFNVSNSDYLFLPGSSLTIEQGGTCNISSGVHVTFAKYSDLTVGYKTETDGSITTKTISDGFGTRCVDKNDSYVLISGTMNVSGCISGLLIGGAENAVLTFGNTAKLSTSANTYNAAATTGYTDTALKDKCYTLTPSVDMTLTDVNASPSVNTGYVSTGNTTTNDAGEEQFNFEGWQNASVAYFYVEIYDDDGITLLEKLTILVVDETSYYLSPSILSASKAYHEFDDWYNMDGTEFTGVTLNETDNTTTTDTTYKVKASWTEIEYSFGYIPTYGYDAEGNPNYITEGELSYSNENDKFTISSFNNNVAIGITTTITYTLNDDDKFFDGWYLGTDKGIGIRVTEITKSMFEEIVNRTNGSTVIPLYCEFTDNPLYNVVLTDPVNNVITKGFSIESGSTILNSGFNIPEFSTIDFDNDPSYEFYFYGFYLDVNNNNIRDNNEVAYTIDELEELEITADMNLEVYWNNKFKLIYSENDYDLVIPGEETNLRDAIQKETDKSNTNYYIKYTFAKWLVDGVEYNSSGKYIVPNIPGGNAEVTAKWDRSYEYVLTITLNSAAKVSINDVEYSTSTTISYQVNNTDEKITVNFIASQQGEKYLTVDLTTTKGTDVRLNDGNESQSTYTGSFEITSHAELTVKGTNDCLVKGSLITLFDGSQKKVEDLQPSDLLLVWNHETGKFDYSPVIFLIHKNEKEELHRIITLKFSNGKEVKIVSEHGFFSLDEKKYVQINELNVKDYIGHSFANTDDLRNIESITLVSYYITEEITTIYSPITFKHLNCFVDGILTVTNCTDGLVNYFELDENMKYDEEKMQQDIEKYGLFTYEEWAPYASYETFLAFNGAYVKVAVGKGLTTIEDIIERINIYINNDNTIQKEAL